ncbi:hypothetical protein ACFP9V_21180 [Deinococcus radiopugnans]|uniref:hypothetical protein n=1 Tax=Deinococcus radiopugnans TaxID=57497 RepID=UPI003622289A
MTGAPGADPSQRQPPLDALAQLTTRLAQVTERSAQLDIVAGVLRQLLGDVTVTFLSLQGAAGTRNPGLRRRRDQGQAARWPQTRPRSGRFSRVSSRSSSARTSRKLS